MDKEVKKTVLIKSEKMIEKMFNKVFGIAYYGEHFNDTYNMGIPYEFDAEGNISKLNSKIYNLKCTMATEFNGKDSDIDDYEHLCELTSLYERLLQEYCYKMFFYGFTLNPENLLDN